MIALSFTPGEREIFAKREIVAPSRWATRSVIVQDGLYAGSPVRMDAAPYMAGILDLYARRGVEELIVCGSPQVGKTLILYICLGWAMDFRPGTKMLAMPTRETRDRVSKEKLLPLLKGSPVLRRQIGKPRADNIPLKNGSNIWLATAESPGQRASITVQDLFLDEEDIYETATAVDDFKGRTRSLDWRAKILRVSQIKGDESSSIWQGITRGVDLLLCYEVQCPACHGYHLPDAGNIVTGGEKDPLVIRRKKLAHYMCPRCSWPWTDHIRDLAVANGRWRPYRWHDAQGFVAVPDQEAVTDPRVVGVQIPAILARSVSLSALAAKRLIAEASDDARLKMQYANDELCLPYTPVELQTDSEKILALTEAWLPPQTVPHGAVALTCGIDAQKRGFWFLVKAWMPNLSSFIVDYGSLEDWEQVRKLLFDTWYPMLAPGGAVGWRPGQATPPEFLTGEIVPIWRAAMDSGGTETDGVFTRTEEVYMWIRANGGGVVHACKSASHAQSSTVRRQIRERLPNTGRPIPGGLPLFMLDSNTIKTVAMSRLINPESSQPCRLHAGADRLLADQLAAEQQIRKSGKLVWRPKEKGGSQNHLLDCLMLADACADATWTPSLPMHVLQLQAEERAKNAPRTVDRKRTERPRQESRWR